MKIHIKENFKMPRSSGTFVTTTTLGESVRAFVPWPLPPAGPPVAPECYADVNRAAELALAKLNGVAGLVPSEDWFIYGAVRKEALLTSLIEGTQATLDDLFDSEAGIEVDNPADVEEVTNYLHAFHYMRDNLQAEDGLPICTRLICDTHHLLLKGVRGAGKQPGELRRSQNWIGGARPGKALFVPPPPERVAELLGELEKFIHTDHVDLPPLVKIALIHAQFETIHPFLDGNGRMGRLLISALLEHWQLMQAPLLYISGYLKQHQASYYRLLSGIRTDGDWEAWIIFFLEGVAAAAAQAESAIVNLATLIANDRRRLLASPTASAVAYRLFESLPVMPRFTVEQVRQRLATTYPTANAAVKALTDLGIVQEMTGQRKNRSFGYQAYIQLLSR